MLVTYINKNKQLTVIFNNYHVSLNVPDLTPLPSNLFVLNESVPVFILAVLESQQLIKPVMTIDHRLVYQLCY